MPEENIQAFLLFLNPEDRKKAQEYIAKRLGVLDPEELPLLGRLITDTKRTMSQVEAGRARFRGVANAYAKVVGRLYDESLVGFAQLLQVCNRTYASKERELKSLKRAEVASQDGRTEVAPLEERMSPEERQILLLEPTEEEEAAALDFIDKRVQAMEIPDLMAFREAIQRLITWWESAQGQMEGLMLSQFGHIHTVQGRRVIREKYEEMQQRVLNPFKTWFQTLNSVVLRKRKEAAERASLGDTRRPA
jgi:transcriptional regulator with XRE-family HTH domain